MSAQSIDLGADIGRLIDNYLDEHQKKAARDDDPPLTQLRSLQAILDARRDGQVQVVMAATARLTELVEDYYRRRPLIAWLDPSFQQCRALEPLIAGVLRKKLPFDEGTLDAFLTSVVRAGQKWIWDRAAVGISGAVEGFAEANGVSDALRKRIERLIKMFQSYDQDATTRKAVKRLNVVLAKHRAQKAAPSKTKQTGAAQLKADRRPVSRVPASVTKRAAKTVRRQPDGFEIPDDGLRSEHELVGRYLTEANKASGGTIWHAGGEELPSAQEALQRDAEGRIRVVLALARRARWHDEAFARKWDAPEAPQWSNSYDDSCSYSDLRHRLRNLAVPLLRKRLPFTDDQLVELCEWVGAKPKAGPSADWILPTAGVAKAVADFVKRESKVSPALRRAAERAAQAIRLYGTRDVRNHANQIQQAVRQVEPAAEGPTAEQASGAEGLVFEPDGYEVATNDPLRAEHELISRWLTETEPLTRQYLWSVKRWSLKGDETPAGRDALQRDPAGRARVVAAGVRRGRWLDREWERLQAEHTNPDTFAASEPGRHHHLAFTRLVYLLKALLRKDLPLGEAELEEVADWIAARDPFFVGHLPLAGITKSLENYAKQNGLSVGLREKVARAVETIRANAQLPVRDSSVRKFANQLDALLARAATNPGKKTHADENGRTSSAAVETVRLEPDSFEIASDDPLRAEHELVGRFFDEARGRYRKLKGRDRRDPKRWKVSAEETLVKEDACGVLPGHDVWCVSSRATLVEQEIIKLKRDRQVRVFSALILRLARLDERCVDCRRQGWKARTAETEDLWKDHSEAMRLAGKLLRRDLPFLKEPVLMLARILPRQHRWLLENRRSIVRAIKTVVEEHGLDEEFRGLVISLNEEFDGDTDLQRLLQTATSPDVAYIPLETGEAWSDQALADLHALPGAKQQAWSDLLVHCLTATAGQPAEKWLSEAAGHLGAVGRQAFSDAIVRWFPLVDKPRTQPLARPHWWGAEASSMAIVDPHADILKGLAWCCALFEGRDIARALAGLAISAYRKVPQIGPRLTRVGNAAVWALGAMPGRDAVGQLALLKIKVKFGTAQKGVEKALAAAADREGLPRDELEEMAVPAYGLENVGVRDERLGEYTARLTVTGTTSTELTWLRPDGKPQKSVPAAVRKGYAEELKELSAAAKDIQKMLPAQRDRIDGLFLQRKHWPLPIWRERYLEHPLIGTLARRLVWQFTTGRRTAAGIWLDDRLVGADDRPLTGLGDNTTVELWHPIGRPIEEVLAWREWLQSHEVRQPFKQAHRELYLLTDAERRTRTYSNRYAAHILRQHQFNALCAARGWKNQLRLMVDADYPPATRLLPEWGLRAEFWVEGAGDNYGTDTNETGTYLYLATDQVRFYSLEAARRSVHASGGGYHTHGPEGSDTPLALEDVPPLVFSEIMRDVDMFVGVASVGNDPNWSDGGPEGRYRGYWQSYSFGDLSATAQTRRETLQRLVPRLKIAERCSFDERFLVVRGDLRSYKIHLGSGNILMSPNDQYLCIVPKQSSHASDGTLFLPFEGDSLLSVILSKALLLAEDRSITDPTITSQIRQR